MQDTYILSKGVKTMSNTRNIKYIVNEFYKEDLGDLPQSLGGRFNESDISQIIDMHTDSTGKLDIKAALLDSMAAGYMIGTQIMAMGQELSDRV